MAIRDKKNSTTTFTLNILAIDWNVPSAPNRSYARAIYESICGLRMGEKSCTSARARFHNVGVAEPSLRNTASIDIRNILRLSPQGTVTQAQYVRLED